MESFSFVAPVAYLLELLVYWTDQSRVLTFGIAAVLGTIVGSAAMALATKTFRWEGFATTEDLVNHVAGGILMGFGGVTALGLHDRSGALGRLDAGAGLVSCILFDHRGLRCRAEVPDVAGRADAGVVNAERRQGTFSRPHDRIRPRMHARSPFRGLVRLGGRLRATVGRRARALSGLRRRGRRARAVGEGSRRPRRAPACDASSPTDAGDGATKPLPEFPRTSLAKVRDVIRNTENVGRRFPEEARKIHYEEAPARPIRGQASKEESEALSEEGIDFSPLPDFLTRDVH